MSVKAAIVAAVLVGAAASASLSAQRTVAKLEDKVTVTATIQQLDSTLRLITFKNEDGTEDQVWAGPDMKRFDELKVGDKVTLTYYTSRVFQVRKPGEAAPLNRTNTSAVTPSGGALPGGTMSEQRTETVTVKAVDPSVPSITVTTKAGRVVTRKIENKAHLEGVKPGDQIDIIYTEALLASVERAK